MFVQTPTLEDLKARLEARGTETEESLAKRLGNAQKEIEAGKALAIFQKYLVNGEKEQFIGEAEAYIIKELYGIKKATK